VQAGISQKVVLGLPAETKTEQAREYTPLEKKLLAVHSHRDIYLFIAAQVLLSTACIKGLEYITSHSSELNTAAGNIVNQVSTFAAPFINGL
jgi:hypothetical protein